MILDFKKLLTTVKFNTLSKTVPTFNCVKLKIGSKVEVFLVAFHICSKLLSICQIEIQHFLILDTPLHFTKEIGQIWPIFTKILIFPVTFYQTCQSKNRFGC